MKLGCVEESHVSINFYFLKKNKAHLLVITGCNKFWCVLEEQ